MFTKNQFVSQDLQDAIKKIMNGDSVEEAKIVHPNQQRIDVHEPEKDEITADDFKKLRGMKKEKPMTKEEEEVLYGLANDWGEYLEINAFGIHQSMQNKEIYLSNDLLKIIVFNEKYKLDHKIGFGQLSDFLEKHEITWGHITGMRKVMKNYYDVLENYKNRKP